MPSLRNQERDDLCRQRANPDRFTFLSVAQSRVVAVGGRPFESPAMLDYLARGFAPVLERD